jgi:hypothetical protein
MAASVHKRDAKKDEIERLREWPSVTADAFERACVCT